MSILIRGMEMPQNCDRCRFQSELKLYCDAMPYNFCGNTDDIERPDWCPLIELPPHGRLIDIDDAIESYGERVELGYVSQSKFLNVVIEAEGSET